MVTPVRHMDIRQIHTPVMLERTIEILGPALEVSDAVFIDATLGMGGHTEAVLTRFPHVRVLGLDRDLDALAVAKQRLAEFGDRVVVTHTVYDGIERAWRETGLPRPTAILFDLGVSSLQLDRAERGFAYAQDADLDMRMDASTGITAAEVLATYDEKDLRRIFVDYGEEKLAARYAKAIVTARGTEAIDRSGRLVAILNDATPMALRSAGHPAKRVFQALRIEVNQELAALETALPAALDLLRVGGRIVVLAYQSLEDRMVKQEFAAWSRSNAPVDLPVVPEEYAPMYRVLTRGAELADDIERTRNPRSIPVRLRAAERLREAA